MTLLSDGIFKSTEGWRDLAHIGLRSVGAVNRICVHTSNSQILYGLPAVPKGFRTRGNGAGLYRSGFYRSTDGGENGRRSVTVSTTNGGQSGRTTTKSIFRLSNSVLRLDRWRPDFPPSSASTAWPISGGIRVSLAIAPSEPNRSTLAARVQSGQSSIRRPLCLEPTRRDMDASHVARWQHLQLAGRLQHFIASARSIRNSW